MYDYDMLRVVVHSSSVEKAQYARDTSMPFAVGGKVLRGEITDIISFSCCQ